MEQVNYQQINELNGKTDLPGRYPVLDNNTPRWRIDFTPINNCIAFYLDEDTEIHAQWASGSNKASM